MSRGLSRSQIGVTEAMVQSFGETIFRLSHNHQVRRGDPVRLKDFAAIERQRAGLGLSDAEISGRVGLSRDQVTFIRNLVERRKIRRNHYQRLLELGGGRRFRAERFTPHEQRRGYREAAMNLRDAMRFDGDRAAVYLERGWWSPADTLSRWLARAASETPDAPAIVGGGQILSYRELAGRVAALAGGLKGLGLGSGDVVAVQLPNRVEYLVSYLAICAIGGVMTTLYVPYRAAEMETLLTHSRARAFIGLDAMGDFRPTRTVLDLRGRTGSPEHVIVLGEASEGAWGATGPVAAPGGTGDVADPADAPGGASAFVGSADAAGGTSAFADLAGAPPHDLSDGPVAADPFLLLYTSGTSARPKGVPLAYQGILGNARLGAPEHGITAADRILSAAPFGHLYGLYSFHLALSVGAATVLLPAFTPPDLARTLDAEAVTVLFAAPAHVAACLGAGLLSTGGLSRLRLAVLSGSAVAPAVAKGLQERMANGHVTQLWGMTETQAGLYTRPGDPIETVAGTAGRPSPGTEVRIVGAGDTALPPGEEGELQVRGSLLFPGYFDHPEANREAFSAGGWFRTGDLAVVTGEGNVAITGRCKDVINRGGIKYNPRDVEDLLAAHPQIDMAAIVPVADPVLGERACCCITVAGGAAPTLDAVCAYLHENGVAKVRWPERLEVLDAMPLTATRKIVKGRLVERLERTAPDQRSGKTSRNGFSGTSSRRTTSPPGEPPAAG